MTPMVEIAVVLAVLGLSGLRIAQEYQRGVVFRLGRYVELRGPGEMITRDSVLGSTSEWGLEVQRFEMKDGELPVAMQQVMAMQAGVAGRHAHATCAAFPICPCSCRNRDRSNRPTGTR